MKQEEKMGVGWLDDVGYHQSETFVAVRFKMSKVAAGRCGLAPELLVAWQYDACLHLPRYLRTIVCCMPVRAITPVEVWTCGLGKLPRRVICLPVIKRPRAHTTSLSITCSPARLDDGKVTQGLTRVDKSHSSARSAWSHATL